LLFQRKSFQQTHGIANFLDFFALYNSRLAAVFLLGFDAHIEEDKRQQEREH